MGVIIKYQLKFPEVKLTISNDLYLGDFIIDADIKVEMLGGASGCKFDIKLYDLHEKTAKKLYDKLGKGGLTIEIKLGYFDGPFKMVTKGVVKKVNSSVDGDKLITTIQGTETATLALKETKLDDFKSVIKGATSLKDAVTKLLKKAKEGVDKEPVIMDNVPSTPDLVDLTPRGANLTEVLDDLTRFAKVELLIYDGKLRIGKPILDDEYKPGKLRYGTSLAVFRPFAKEIPDEDAQYILDPLKATKANGFEFTITGDPQLRPAQKVVADVEDFDKPSAPEFRVHSVVHELSMSGGFTSKGVAVKICADDNCRRQQDSVSQATADGIVRSLIKGAQASARNRPAVEIAKVKTYNTGDSSAPEKHQATLYYNQRFKETETQPSIRVDVDADEDQLLPNKPIVSPFAWHKCGLVVPIYPGMKSLVTHNLSLPDDALVTGFIWSKKPAIDPPKNKEGDWWLCLPIDFDVTKPPTDSTKAANDLTANNGKRVIELKGLKITVGADKLGNVGARPQEGGDDEFLIEHKKAKIKISSDGTIEMTADANGGVTLKISSSAIEVS